MLKRETKIQLRHFINIQAYRDIAIEISRRWMQLSSQFPSDVREERETALAALDTDAEKHINKMQWLEYITDLQATHLSHMTGMISYFHKRKQTATLQAIQDGESPVITIMQTDGKKSILFMLPVFAEPGRTTIIMILLLRRPPDKATIVLVTPKSVVTENFHTFINRLQQTRRLDWIRDFRSELRQLGRLNHARTRPNVAYRMWDIPGGLIWFTSEPVLVFIQERIQQAGHGKMIIYTNIILQMRGLAQILQCETYYNQ
ncbi:hypothetical protein BDV34DRAFT_218315 [Aspergillus parasiticus]|uniref:Uncharacterized protein n=1 Tax=Aspergillus parasiticus TaxID=5067 RepID=A0A5N6D2H7_ASPPA|nr:hypothetical protein BDV34DRAFT_218315 [Aspergillus parasiticus]